MSVRRTHRRYGAVERGMSAALLLVLLIFPCQATAACGTDLSGSWVEDLEHMYETVSHGDPYIRKELEAHFSEPRTSLELTRSGVNRYIAFYRETGFKEIGLYSTGLRFEYQLAESGENCLLTIRDTTGDPSDNSITTPIKRSEKGFCIRATTDEEAWGCYVRGQTGVDSDAP